MRARERNIKAASCVQLPVAPNNTMVTPPCRRLKSDTLANAVPNSRKRHKGHASGMQCAAVPRAQLCPSIRNQYLEVPKNCNTGAKQGHTREVQQEEAWTRPMHTAGCQTGNKSRSSCPTSTCMHSRHAFSTVQHTCSAVAHVCCVPHGTPPSHLAWCFFKW